MTDRSLRAVRATTALVAIAGAVGAWYALRSSWQVPLPTLANPAEQRMQDFRDALYFPIREFLDGGNPYDPATMFAHWPVRQAFNLYQPYHLVLNMPFALVPYRVGAVAFAVVSLLLLVLLAWMAANRIRFRVPLPLGTAVLATLLVTSQVGKAQLYLGQVNPLVAVGAAGALLTRSSHPRWAALALAVAWLKPQFGFPLAVLLFARGSRRVALAGTAVAALASLPWVMMLIARSGGVGPFLDVIAANLAYANGSDYGSVHSVTAQRVDVPAVLFRLTGWGASAAEPVLPVAILAIGVLLVRRLDQHGDLSATALADLLTCLTVVVAVVHQPGDIMIAVPAMGLVVMGWWQHRQEPGWRACGMAIGALAVPFLHLHVVDRAIVALLGERASVTVDGAAIVTAWVLLVVFALRLTRSRRSVPTPLVGSAR